MSRVKSRNTRPERRLRSALWAAGLRGYRISPRGVPGRPDIAFIGKRVAVFVHGCFWHRCPRCALPLPKSNREFWRAKFARNRARDKRKTTELQREGWIVHEFWECEVRDDLPRLVKRVAKTVRSRK